MNSAGETTGGDFSQIIKPDWNKGQMYERLGKQVIELPLDSVVKLGFFAKAPVIEQGKFNLIKALAVPLFYYSAPRQKRLTKLI